MAEKVKITISTEFIKLDSAMKLGGAVSLGSDAKHEIIDGNVSVNGTAELRRGKKLYKGDNFKYNGITYEIV